MEDDIHHFAESESLQTVIKVQRGFLLAALGLSSFIFGSKACPWEFTRCVKKPVGLWMSILVTVLLSPLIAYIVVLAMDLETYEGIALMVTSCCPAGNLSPIFAYYTQSDVCLCLLVIVLSNLMSIGMIPLGMFFCSSAYTELDLTIIPLRLIMLTMFVSIASIALGMAFRAYEEKWADKFVKVFSWTPIVVILVMVIIVAVKIPHSLHASLKEIFATLLYIVVVMCGTYVAGLLVSREHYECRSMAFCTGNKSIMVALTIVHVSFDGEFLVSTLPVPNLFIIQYITIGLVLSAVYKLYDYYNFLAFTKLLQNLRPLDNVA